MEQANKGIQVTNFAANRPASSRNAVIFCCDQNYLPFATHAASQIAALHPERDFDLCICTSRQEISVPKSLGPLGLRVCAIDVGNVFEGLRLDSGKTHDVYLRLALPTTFAKDYDRILYLDSDVFIQGGDFSALMKIDMDRNAIAAVRDNLQWRTPGRQTARNALPGQKSGAYFNAGVVLMDVQACRNTDLLGRCVSFGRAHAKELKRHDQNLQNAVLQGQWAELSPMWNWQFSWAARFFATVRSPHIIHFIGPVKPWKDPLGELEPRFADAMRRFTQEHFPDFPFDRVPRGTLAPDSPRMTKMLIKHLLSRRKIARYLARFPDDMTVQR